MNAVKLVGLLCAVAALARVQGVAVGNAVVRGDFDMFPCEGMASYKITFNFAWEQETHPEACPKKHAFAPPVVVSHNSFYTLWAPNAFASFGVRKYAERASPKWIQHELNDLLYRSVGDYEVAREPSLGTGSLSYELVVHRARSHVSAMSMLFPSPDWFTGFSHVELCNDRNGKWIDSVEGDMAVWDAGTDKGLAFGAAPDRREPQIPIRSLLFSKFGGKPVGTWKLELLDDELNEA